MSTSSNNPDSIAALVNSLEAHEGISMTPRERQLCTTLLSGLAAADQLVAPIPADGLLDFDFATASERERWSYDCGRQDALDGQKMTMDEIQDALEAVVEALRRMTGEQS
ncbi:hypothetical protein AB0L70_10090 [Kribbella sp. NPDC051952]|uniref:hypothetical protein n=1 Tax=Kribbella sp. NPDC051952 TaxID=3154851 RepID=UPI003449B098